MMGMLGQNVDFTVVVRTAPERCYDAAAPAKGLDAWFTTGAELQARPGGRPLFRWGD